MSSALPWSCIDTVLLDMDGTLLDLRFDNHFWLEHLPDHYARQQGLSPAAARQQLHERFERKKGQLDWYCLDYWSHELGLPIQALKREIAHLIAPRPGALDFLASLRRCGKRVILITNAHPDSLALKLERIDLAPWFEQLISAHSYGYPKEHPAFWQCLQQTLQFIPGNSLFIDDSPGILRSARQAGIGWLRAVARPDSGQPPVNTAEFTAIDDYHRLSKELAQGVRPAPEL